MALYKHIINTSYLYRNIPINIYAIGGNHGEIRGGMPRKYKDNYDLIIANYLEIALRQRQLDKNDIDNVSITVSEDSVSAYINLAVGHRIELIHEIPKNLMTPKAEGMAMAKHLNNGVDLIFSGHFHSPAYHELGKIKLVRSGTLVGPNQFSHELGIPHGSRQQTIILSTKENAGEIIISINPTTKLGDANE
jgi:predicted phosphodiesterase